jgi:hypothetical protein
MWKYLEYVEDYRAVLKARRDSRYLDYPFLVSFETIYFMQRPLRLLSLPRLNPQGDDNERLFGR